MNSELKAELFEGTIGKRKSVKRSDITAALNKVFFELSEEALPELFSSNMCSELKPVLEKQKLSGLRSRISLKDAPDFFPLIFFESASDESECKLNLFGNFAIEYFSGEKLIFKSEHKADFVLFLRKNTNVVKSSKNYSPLFPYKISAFQFLKEKDRLYRLALWLSILPIIALGIAPIPILPVMTRLAVCTASLCLMLLRLLYELVINNIAQRCISDIKSFDPSFSLPEFYRNLSASICSFGGENILFSLLKDVQFVKFRRNQKSDVIHLRCLVLRFSFKKRGKHGSGLRIMKSNRLMDLELVRNLGSIDEGAAGVHSWQIRMPERRIKSKFIFKHFKRRKDGKEK